MSKENKGGRPRAIGQQKGGIRKEEFNSQKRVRVLITLRNESPTSEVIGFRGWVCNIDGCNWSLDASVDLIDAIKKYSQHAIINHGHLDINEGLAKVYEVWATIGSIPTGGAIIEEKRHNG